MNNPTILLTGATGFLGKVVLEELIRRRKELHIEKILLLIRARTPTQARRRFENEIRASECFNGLPSEWTRGIEPIAGELTRANSGLDDTARKRACSTVTHIIHCAASIEFDLPLREATLINTAGSLGILELAQKCKKNPSLLVVSTAYVTPCPTDGSRVREELAPLPRPAKEIYSEILEDRIDRETALTETGHPNTYTLTKCLAEHLLVEQSGNVPLSIVRPSIISATQSHPFPGWIDSQAAFAGFVTMCGLGHMRAVAARPSVGLDVVPCDAVAHRIVQLSLKNDASRNGAPFIRHAVNGKDHSCKIDACRRQINHFFRRHRIGTGPRIRFVGPAGHVFRFFEWLHHTCPGTIAYSWYRITRRKARGKAVKRRLERVNELNRVFRYFTHHVFDFESTEPMPLTLNVETYLGTICSGVHKYLLRQNPKEISIAGREHGTNDWTILFRRPKGERWARLRAWLLTRLLRNSSNLVTFDLTAFERIHSEISSDERPILVTSRQSRLDGAILSLLCLARPDLELRHPHVLKASSDSGRILRWKERSMGTYHLPTNWNPHDRRLVRKIADVVATRATLILPLDVRPSPIRGPRLLRRGLLDGLQATGRRFVLIPVAVNYDRVPEESSFLRELSGGMAPSAWAIVVWVKNVIMGGGDLGRIHVGCGEPTRLDLDCEISKVEPLLRRRLRQAYAPSTFHLRSFLLATAPPEIDLHWLSASLLERGTTVIRSRMREAAPETVEITFRTLWRHQFVADAIVITGNNPLLDALSSDYSRPEGTELADPRFAHLVTSLVEPWLRQCVAAAHRIGRPPQPLRCRTPQDLVAIVPGVEFFSAEAIFSALERSEVIAQGMEGYHWGPRARDIDFFLASWSQPERSRRADTA